MGAKSKDDILAFYSDFDAKSNLDFAKFNKLIAQLFDSRELDGCTFFTSLHVFCIVRFPTYAEWRDAPLLSLKYASSANVLIELTVTQTRDPALRTSTRASNIKYETAMSEFDRLYDLFLLEHE